ncbi:sulfotransferase 2B1-like [Rhineura floridana]|uniref:sulfotransferase 2B1-like n=1 Tax=Rhineura floridana TaxID=261503 RepID=UPI002AC84B01|nr:sulfotransferase 2B1-like [Rhineura floridana]XP_061453768.1 sulfotransferase 2B1-like [Rhineura floridana]XP_061453769.1 sulfotransferase 2B1-like [Rhineura floridana]
MASITYKGITLPVVDYYSVETLSYVENEFQLLDDDVVTVTYPKSGTHWMLEILNLIWRDGDPSWVQNLPVWERTPWLENTDGLKLALKYPPPRLLTTHLPFHIFPKSFLSSKAKVIYTLRNPKDVLISLYHFCKGLKMMEDPGIVEDFMESFLHGKLPYGSWFDHVKGWMVMKDRPNIFFITYEELQQDLRHSVERICQFLGKELNSQQISSVVENASFHKMKDNKMSNFSLFPDTYFDHTKGKMMRKGISGDWKNHLTVAQSERFDQVYQENMRGVSMTFPWD